MVEILISVQVPNTHLRPIEISILYNEDGQVESIDWREALDSENEMEWSDQDSDEDPSYIPAIDTEDEYSDYSDYSDY